MTSYPSHAHPPHTASSHTADELIPFATYRADVLARISALEPIEVGLAEAHDCVLAEDVAARHHLPPFPNSAMDGFAVRAEDAPQNLDRPLRIAGEVAAGAAILPEVGPGEAVRIMTGAPLPPGADTVVPVEQVEEDEAAGTVRVPADLRLGAHIRAAGEDVRAGETVLRSGRHLDAADVGMLAALGMPQVLVRPQPRVALIATGDELVEPGSVLGPGQIRDANSFTLTALVRETGATGFRHAIVPDDRRALTEAFEGALSHADLLVTTGGVSAGRYDLVKEILGQLGDVAAVKVAMRPGMPQAFGLLGRGAGRAVPCFGLPGNPVSAFVSFQMLVRPAIRRLQGRSDTGLPRITAVLEEPVRSAEGKTEFLRVRLHRAGTEWYARSTGEQGSGILRSAVLADGLAELAPDRTNLAAGEHVPVHVLTRP